MRRVMTVDVSVSVKKTPGRGLSNYRRSQWLWAYGLISPTIIGLIVLNIYPFIYTIWLSFKRSQGLGRVRYIGVKNFVDMFEDTLVWNATINTLYFTLLTVPIGIILALILAALLNNKIRCRDLYRGIYFMPMVVAPAAVAMVWRWIFNAEFGILNQFLLLFGIKGPSWLADPNTAILSCAIINIWSAVGYDLVLILAGLQSISRSYYEASEIDGANALQSFRHITIPLISPTLFFVVIMRAMTALKQFDTVYLLIKTQNPAYSRGVTLMSLFYREAFEKFNKGYASAIVLLSFVIISAVTAIQFIAEKKLVHYD
ncbi:MAG: sugar ABC transporter permease [Clostridia bacterium]|nr:sugar ABC transporter permease [Clostridia bacterium]